MLFRMDGDGDEEERFAKLVPLKTLEEKGGMPWDCIASRVDELSWMGMKVFGWF